LQVLFLAIYKAKYNLEVEMPVMSLAIKQ